MRRGLWAWLRRLGPHRIFRRQPALYAVECRWCQLYKGATAEPAIVGWSLVPGSSGICPECRLRAMDEAGMDKEGGA